MNACTPQIHLLLAHASIMMSTCPFTECRAYLVCIEVAEQVLAVHFDDDLVTRAAVCTGINAAGLALV